MLSLFLKLPLVVPAGKSAKPEFVSPCTGLTIEERKLVRLLRDRVLEVLCRLYFTTTYATEEQSAQYPQKMIFSK